MGIKFIVDLAIIVGNVFICVGVVIAIWQLTSAKEQLILTKESFKADHERRKKQATIEFYRRISDVCDESLEQIEENFSHVQVINFCDIDAVTLKAIRKYLCLMEEISVGINTNVYDDTVFDRIAGVHSIRWFGKLREVIMALRKKNHSPNLYKDFENMVSQIKDVQEKRYPKSELDLAKMKNDPSDTNVKKVKERDPIY